MAEKPKRAWPGVMCHMAFDEVCECTLPARAIRAWMLNEISEPMTPEQRAFCTSEISSRGGVPADFEGANDQALARAVILAWGEPTEKDCVPASVFDDENHRVPEDDEERPPVRRTPQEIAEMIERSSGYWHQEDQ